MRLTHIELGLNMDINENTINVLVVEHPSTFRLAIEEILKQIEGRDGLFVLSNGNENLPISKHVEMVLNPFQLDFNSRKIQNKLFQLVKTDIEENLVVELCELNVKILGFLEKALRNQPYSVEYNYELDVQSLMKTYHVGFREEELEFIEKLIEFIRIQAYLMRTSLLIFVNLKSFLSEIELIQLYKFAFYCKMNIVLLESSSKNRIDSESTTIIDEDRCVIEN